ncbi:phage tail protein, partial [Citrobacter freundii]
QILAALKKLFLSRSNPFVDIKADGAAAIATALSNLGLGEGSALPVGVPVPWPSATPPAGWLKCNGAAFTAA